MNFKPFKEIAKVHFQRVTVPLLLPDNGNTGNGVYVALRIAALAVLVISVERWYAIRYAAIYRRRGTTFHDKMAAGGMGISFFKTRPPVCVEVTD